MKRVSSEVISAFRRIALTVALIVGSVCLRAADDGFDPLSASIEENINTPKVETKQKSKVVASQGHLERSMRSAGYKVSRVRSGEVVLVTIPLSELFSPNSVQLSDRASVRLQPLVPYVKRTDNYKIVIAVHSDNTGDDDYADALTSDRAAAVDEYFYHMCGSDYSGIIPYGIGADEPVAPNTGAANRAANRRLEIYFIPTKNLIEKAQKR